MKLYRIVHKGKALEVLSTKSVAEEIADMYRKGEVWAVKKPIDVELIEYEI